MKGIYFSNFSKSYHIIFPIGGATAVVGLNFIKTIPQEQLYWYKVAAYLVIVLYFLKIALENLLLKNFVRWTRGVIQIRIGTRKSTVIHFEDITSHQYSRHLLTIKTTTRDFVFDLHPYKERSVQKLLEIIKANA